MAKATCQVMNCLVKTVKHFTVNKVTDKHLFRNAPPPKDQGEKP